jgi:hypothetical protein
MSCSAGAPTNRAQRPVVVKQIREVSLSLAALADENGQRRRPVR